MGSTGLSNSAWQIHTNALFETAGKYPEEHYNWLFGSLFMIFVMIITSRIDGSCANYLFLFNRMSHPEATFPCMSSQFQCLSTILENRVENVWCVNMVRWTYNQRTLLITNFSPDFLFKLFADYTKLMGTPIRVIVWLVFMWMAFDKIQNMPTTMRPHQSLFNKCREMTGIFIVCVRDGLMKSSIFVLQTMLPACGIQMVFALSMMLCVQIQSAYTYQTNSKLNLTNHFVKLDAGVWNQLFNTYSSASLYVIHLSAKEIAELTDHVVAVVRVGIDVVLMVASTIIWGFS